MAKARLARSSSRDSRSFLVVRSFRLCSVLNLLLSKWTGDYDFDSHAKLVRTFFLPPIAARIIASRRLAFHRHQLLYVDRGVVETCTILTTKPNALVADVHSRMPAILKVDDYDLWLDPRIKNPALVTGCLKPFDASLMKKYPVSTRVNRPRCRPR